MNEPKRRKLKIQPEMLVGISAVVIGLCALAVSFYETKLMREEQRAAVMPLLELARSHFVDSENSEDNRTRLWLHTENVGIGPARVLDFKVTVDGKPYPTWGAAMQALLGRNTPINYGQSTIIGRTIPPERTVRMFDLHNIELAEDILAQFDRLDFEACFCSIFDECWVTSYSTFGASEPVESCERSEGSFTE